LKIVDQVKLDKELVKLKDEIMGGRNDPSFLVSSLPAGTYKTTTFIDAMKELHNKGGKRKTLFVQFNQDVGGQDIAKRINNACGDTVAKAVDSTMKPYEINDPTLANYEVLVITHEMYLSLNNNQARRAVLTKGREILVIDEEVNWIKKRSISRERIETFISDLPRGLRDKFEKLVLPVEKLLGQGEQLKNNQITVLRNVEYFSDDYLDYIMDFEKDIAVNIDEEYLMKLNRRSKEKRSKDYFKEMCKTLKIVSNSDVVVDRTGVTVFDDTRHPLMLANNIMLDANSGFFTGYQMADHFNVASVSGITDYSDWNFHICKKNSSKTSKAGYINYYEEIRDHINTNTHGTDKVLIVGSKDERAQFTSILENGRVEYVHFQEMAGKNNWYDYNKVYIIDTLYFSQRDYVVDALYYRKHLRERYRHDHADYFVRQARSYAASSFDRYLNDPDESFEEYSDDIGLMYENAYSGMFASLKLKQYEDDRQVANDEVVEFKKGSYGTFEFNDKEVDDYRTTKVAGSIYQATMRIGRIHGMQQPKDVYIVNNNKGVLDVVLKQFPGASVNDDFNINIKTKSQQRKAAALKSYEIAMIDFVNKHGVGEYAKRQVNKAIGLKSANFKDSILRNVKLQQRLREQGYAVKEKNRHKILIENVIQ